MGDVGSREAVRNQFGLTKKERIFHPREFKGVMKSGKRRFSRNLLLFIQKNDREIHRLGIVVKKEAGTAVFRNRIKRYVREFFRLHKQEIKGSFDMILSVKKGCFIQKYKDAEGELEGLLISEKEK